MLEYGLLTFGSLFAIVDPIAAVPTFLSMTAEDTLETRRRIIRTACLTCGVVLALFSALGPAIFRMLGITMPAFRIAGGLVLLLSSLDMLRAKRSALKETAEETEAGMRKEDIAVTPLAVPMLSGPGAITTSIVLASRASTWERHAIFYLCVVLVSFATYVILYAAASGSKRLSPIAINIISRLMGLLLAAVGVQFILSALNIA